MGKKDRKVIGLEDCMTFSQAIFVIALRISGIENGSTYCEWIKNGFT